MRYGVSRVYIAIWQPLQKSFQEKSQGNTLPPSPWLMDAHFCFLRYKKLQSEMNIILLFQIILGHENSEPRLTQFTCAIYASDRRFSGTRDVGGLWIMIGNGIAYFPMS